MSKDWDLVNLEKIIKHRKEFIEIDDFKKYKRCRVKLHAQGIELRDVVQGAEIKTKKQQICKTDDFLVAEIDAKIGGFGIVPANLDGAIVSSHYFLFEINESMLDIKFLDYFIRTPAFRDQVFAQGSTNYAAIRPNDVLGYTIPIPPLEEQRQIVMRIEELVGKVEEVRSLRQKTLEEVNALIHSNRNEVFEKLRKKLAGVRLDSIAYVQLGKMLSPKAKTGIYPTPYLRNANVQWDWLDLSNVYEMDFDEKEKQKFCLETGDILVCEGGDIGKSAIWNNEIPGCCYQKTLHRIRVDNTKLIPRFMLHHIFWAAKQGHFADIKTQTTIPHLTAVKLKAYKIFVPPLPEQCHIVVYLDELQTKVDSMKRLREQAMKEVNALLPSILDKAFKGEL